MSDIEKKQTKISPASSVAHDEDTLANDELFQLNDSVLNKN